MTRAERSEVRAKLYALRRELREFKNSHIRAFGLRHNVTRGFYGSLHVCGECHVCKDYDGQIGGINFAIRHFGGKLRFEKEG
jgi:hypothetical protein